MSKQDRFYRFNRMVALLLSYADLMNIPIRLGEAHRPYFVARKYSQEGKGIINSKHRYSLAIDIWITKDDGKYISWSQSNPGYAKLGDFWTVLGGVWGGNWKKKDAFHFEWAGRV